MNTHYFNLEKVIAATLFVLFIVSAQSCKKDSTPGANEVWMQNEAFTPSTLNVSVNSTVTWTNKDNTTHNVSSDDKSFVSSDMNNGATFQHQFTKTGTYTYHCTFHSNMTGKIVVQ